MQQDAAPSPGPPPHSPGLPFRRGSVLPIAALGLVLTLVPGAPAVGDALAVDALPFDAVVDMRSSTVEPDEPMGCSWKEGSAWYRFVPAESLKVDASVTSLPYSWDASLDVYVGSPGSLSLVGCGGGEVLFEAVAGETYYLQVGSQYRTGSVLFELAAVPPPANDDRAAATVVDQLPFADEVDTRAATVEADEPFGWWSSGRTVWYTYTVSGPITDPTYLRASMDWPSWVAVYEVGEGGGQQLVAHEPWSLIMQVTYPATYYFQVGAFGSGSGQAGFTLDWYHDTTAPYVWVQNTNAWATDASGSVVDFWLQASDDLDPSPSVECTHENGSVFPIGHTAVTCTATDNSGNIGSATFHVRVYKPPVEKVVVSGVVNPRTGVARLSFAVSCTFGPDPYEVAVMVNDVRLDQVIARRATVHGYGQYAGGYCTAENPAVTIQVEVASSEGRFLPGKGSVTYTLYSLIPGASLYRVDPPVTVPVMLAGNR